MAKARRVRVTREPADSAALETIAELVGADAAGSAAFGGFYGAAPAKLGPLLGEDRRAWLLRADGEPAGFVDADLVDGCVHLSYFVIEPLRRRGVARSAVGQLMGSGAFPTAERLRITVEPENIASAAVARATGFALVGTSEWGEDVWERATVGPRLTGVERFLGGDGRVHRLPMRPAERVELLAWVADRVLSPGEILSERQLGERLGPLTDDVAGLRRALVDHELVERTRSGSAYARTTDVTRL